MNIFDFDFLIVNFQLRFLEELNPEKCEFKYQSCWKLLERYNFLSFSSTIRIFKENHLSINEIM